VAARLAEQLQSHGWQVWWDRDLRSGVDFTREIATRLEAARCVLVLWSTSSVGSHWVRDEANEGLRRQVLVPVRIDDASPPYGFRSLQTLSLQRWLSGRESSELLRLVSDIGQVLEPGAGPTAASTVARQTTGPVRPARRHLRAWWLALAGLAVVGIGFVVFYLRVVLPDMKSDAARTRSIEAVSPSPADTRRDAAPLGTPDVPATDQGRTVSTLGPYATRRRAEEVAAEILRQRGGGRTRVAHKGDGYYVDVLPAR
jgi:TIR domain